MFNSLSFISAGCAGSRSTAAGWALRLPLCPWHFGVLAFVRALARLPFARSRPVWEQLSSKGSCSSLLLLFLLISSLWNVSQGDFWTGPALLHFFPRKATRAWAQLNTWPRHFASTPSLSLLLVHFWCFVLGCSGEKGLCIIFSAGGRWEWFQTAQRKSPVWVNDAGGPRGDSLGCYRQEAGWLLPLVLGRSEKQAACCCWVHGCHGNTPRAIALVAVNDVYCGTLLNIIALPRIW